MPSVLDFIYVNFTHCWLYLTEYMQLMTESWNWMHATDRIMKLNGFHWPNHETGCIWPHNFNGVLNPMHATECTEPNVFNWIRLSGISTITYRSCWTHPTGCTDWNHTELGMVEDLHRKMKTSRIPSTWGTTLPMLTKQLFDGLHTNFCDDLKDCATTNSPYPGRFMINQTGIVINSSSPCLL